MTHPVLLLGCGKIGRTIASLLTANGDYTVRAADVDRNAAEFLGKRLVIETLVLDAADPDALRKACRGCRSIISALSYRFNPLVAEIALESGADYFDLTEDVETTRQVRRIAAHAGRGQIFLPQCGLAPGFISILSTTASAVTTAPTAGIA